MVVVYGLKNCDSCRAARKWLAERGIDHHFHDVRSDGLAADRLDAWARAVGWAALVNRRGTTWRNLSDADKARAEAEPGALLAAHPALVKRPVFEIGGDVVVGFKAAEPARIEQALERGGQ